MGTVSAGTVATLALLLLRITETKEPSYPSEDDAASEPVMQPMRFDGRRDGPRGDYTTRRLDRVPSLCERCRCVHTTPANFRLLLVNATGTTTRDRVPSTPPPPVQVQQQQQRQQLQRPGRLSVWNAFKRAVTDLRRRVQRLLDLQPRRR